MTAFAALDHLAQRTRAGMVRWVEGVARRAALVVLAALVLTGAAGWHFATHLAINTDTTDMLSADLPFRQLSRAMSAAFPQLSDNILVVLDGATPDLADAAAADLTARLKARPDLFGSLFDPAGDPFFRHNGLLFLDIADLEDLGDRLARAQPYVGALWHDPSLRGLFAMLGLAAEHLHDDAAAGLDIAPMLDRLAAVAEDQAAGRFSRLSWRDLMMGRDDSPGANRRLLLIQPALDFGSLQPAEAAIDALRDLAKEMHLDGSQGVTLRLTGSAALAQEELASVQTGLGLAGVLSLVLVVGLLFWGLRSPRLAVGVIVTLVMGLVWTADFAILALGTLNLISVAFAVLFIGLSVDFGIHFALRYREARATGLDHHAALAVAAGGTGGALTLSAVAAAIGFYAFLPTDYVGLAELGLIAGTGMFIALIANLTVLPALMTLMPPRVAHEAAHGAAVRPEHRPARARLVAWTALALGLGAAALLPRANFDFDPLNLKDPETESVATLFDLMADPRTGPYSAEVLAPDLPAARALAARLDALDAVDDARTVADMVPGEQDDKLDVIGETALFLAPALSGTPQAPPTEAQRRAALDALLPRLDALAAGEGDLAKAAARLGRALSAPGLDLADLETRLLAALPAQLDGLRQALNARSFDLEDLPESLRAREVAADGRVKVTIDPKEDLRDRAALERFVTAVRGVTDQATGAPIIILEAGDAVVRAFLEAAALAVAVIAVLLVLVLRRGRDVLLVFAPLVLAALLTVAATVLLDQPFNFANVIVLPLLFGLGVAGGIHIVTRAARDGTARGTSTPRAVVFSALTTMGSFGSIALSGHPGTASMGVLLTLAVTLTLACTLIVLPALMALWPAGEGGLPP
ncbi:MAG: MMPL family transporter [Rhodobacterales bacterium]|nr:MMPL family transporter [Rhodobacterales bacterium]